MANRYRHPSGKCEGGDTPTRFRYLLYQSLAINVNRDYHSRGDRQERRFRMGMKEFGTAIRAARIKAGVSQKMLADRVGLSRESISNYERGEVQVISPALLEAFAATLGMDAHNLARIAGYLNPG